MSYIIRRAEIKDIDAISEQLEQFSACYNTHFPPYKDKETSAEVLKNMIENHYFTVAEDGGELVGFIAGFVARHIYNPDIVTLAEAFWWTKEEHRRSGIGLRLLEEFENWGKENVDWILMTIEEETPLDDKVFLDRGFKLKEKSYIMEVH